MTESPEPTNAELLAFMQTAFSQLTTAIAGVRADVAASEDRLRGEIQATEASLVARVNAVQEVVRSVKADVAAHVNDPAAHHRHAA